MASEKIEFRPPKGVIPEDIGDGDTFDLVSTYRLKGQDVCLVMMGDMKMPGYDDKESDYNQKTRGQNRKNYSDVTTGMQSAMMNGSAPADGGEGY